MPVVLLLLVVASSVFGAFGSLVPAATYFVNQEIGSDANPGTVSQPFLTVGKCTSTITTGQSCAVYGGTSVQSVFYESAILTGTNQALVGYGNFQPILDCTNTVSGGAWSNYSGAVYQATVTTDTNSAGFLSIWEDGVQLSQSASLAALTSPGYFVTGNGSLAGTSHTVYLYATGGGNPASNGKAYRYNARLAGVFSAQPNLIVSNVATRKNYYNGGSFEVGKGALLTDITATDGTKHNMLIHTGTTVNGVTLSRAYYAGQGAILLVFNDDSPAGEPISIKNLTCSMPVYSVGFDCLFGHFNISGIFGTLTVNGANISNVQNGITVGSVTNAVLSNLTISGVSQGLTIYNPTQVSASTITTTGNVASISYPTTVSFTNSALSGASTNSAVVYSFGQASALTVTGCTITTATGFGVWNDQPGGSLTMSGNTFVVSGGANDYISLSSILTSDHNILGTGQVNINGAYRTRAQACSLFGQECNSTP